MSFIYRGLKATLNRHTVTGAEIDRQMERLQQQYPRIAVVTDRPTQSGDEVVLDYAGFCDGQQFAGGTAEKQTLVLGSGTAGELLAVAEACVIQNHLVTGLGGAVLYNGNAGDRKSVV